MSGEHSAEKDASFARRPFGVWGYCDSCGHDAWVVVAERDELDEPAAYACGGGCRNGCADCADEDDLNDYYDSVTPGGSDA